MKRRSLMMPDELWAKVHEEAAQETMAAGATVSGSDLVRRAVTAYVESPLSLRLQPGKAKMAKPTKKKPRKGGKNSTY